MAEKNPGWVYQAIALPPSLKDNRADADRLLDALKPVLKADQISCDLSLIKRLPEQLRQWSYQALCLCFKDQGKWELVGAKGIHDPRPFLGIAMDIGTTRMALDLIQLETGQVIGETALDNPQIAMGVDILERIHFAGQKDGLQTLHQLVIEALNSVIAEICTKAGFVQEDVYLLAAAGNTAMTHLLLGLPPQWIIREPYIPAVNRPDVLKASEIGVCTHENARIFVFPNVGSYFGGDLISGILFSGMFEKETISLLVDVGTNAEVALGNKDWLVACAGAAGPALEGGMSAIGMTAKPGVIDEIIIDPDTYQFHLRTIDHQPPIGICGSGMIDLAAQLFLSGMIDFRGKLVQSKCSNRFKEDDGMRRLVIVRPEESGTRSELAISQADLDSLIRSKAAMYTILETITRYVGITFADISKFYVAGAFGSLIRPRSAISIGMVPDLPDEKFVALGNSSLKGAILALTSRNAYDRIESIRSRVTYLELNVNQEFMNRFSAAKFLPHTDPGLFPSVNRAG
jgi:uncharacterized 2Fe-2S/4Fe-4S cluster protein (DUF4445 family)